MNFLLISSQVIKKNDIFQFYYKIKIPKYCKSGNIRGTLIFAYFAQIQQARIQKPAKIFAVPKWQVSICSARI